MFLLATAVLLVAMGLVMCRALLGPTAYDRVLALNNFGTKTVLLIALLGFLAGRPEFLDLSLVYALINFIGTIAVLKYFEHGRLGSASPPASPAESLPAGAGASASAADAASAGPEHEDGGS